MVYDPTTWETGDTVTAEKLNKIENALSDIGNYFNVAFEMTDTVHGTVDKTLSEVQEALLSGSRITINGEYSEIGAVVYPNSYMFNNRDELIAYSGIAVVFVGETSYAILKCYIDSTGITIAIE